MIFMGPICANLWCQHYRGDTNLQVIPCRNHTWLAGKSLIDFADVPIKSNYREDFPICHIWQRVNNIQT